MASRPLPQLTSDDQLPGRSEPVTWEGHVLIPLAQNVVGGLALAGLLTIANAVLMDAKEVPAWAWLMGSGAACAVTLLRFFADDWGIITHAYEAGARSRDGEVNALQLELRAARDALANLDPNSNNDRRNEIAQRTKQHAVKMIERTFEGLPTTRKAMVEVGIGQQDWQRACRLLRATGIIDDEGKMQARNPQTAINAIEERLQHDDQRGKTFTPQWR